MNAKAQSGLGELLRYVGEMLDQGAEEHYRTMRLNYRARYTPVLRALHAGAKTVTDITARTHLTQGAISQTVALLEDDGLVRRHALSDGRKSGLQLSATGQDLVARLEGHWLATFAAIDRLEAEIGHPLRQALEGAAMALQRQGFSGRIAAAKQELAAAEQSNVDERP